MSNYCWGVGVPRLYHSLEFGPRAASDIHRLKTIRLLLIHCISMKVLQNTTMVFEYWSPAGLLHYSYSSSFLLYFLKRIKPGNQFLGQVWSKKFRWIFGKFLKVMTPKHCDTIIERLRNIILKHGFGMTRWWLKSLAFNIWSSQFEGATVVQEWTSGSF